MAATCSASGMNKADMVVVAAPDRQQDVLHGVDAGEVCDGEIDYAPARGCWAITLSGSIDVALCLLCLLDAHLSYSRDTTA